MFDDKNKKINDNEVFEDQEAENLSDDEKSKRNIVHFIYLVLIMIFVFVACYFSK